MHSAILWVTSQMQGEDGWQWFVPLVKAVGTERMQAEDFEGKEVNGYPLPSLAERVVITAAKIVVQSRVVADGEWALALVESLLTRKPQNIWLKYQRGRLLILLGRIPEAQAIARQVVVAKRAEFWAWAILGEALLGDDDGKAISCLCKVISLKDDEVFLLSIRELLTKALLNLDRRSEAKTELARTIAVRRSKNLRIRRLSGPLKWNPRLVRHRRRTTLRSTSMKRAKPMTSCLRAIRPTSASVTNIDQKSRSCFITFRLDGSARYRYHRSPWEKNLPEPGTAVLIRVRELPSEQQARCEAVSMQPTTRVPDRSFAREFSGSLKLIAKAEKDPIGFVSDIFVPGALLKLNPLQSGVLVRGIAVKEMNRARGEHGWRAVRIMVVDTKPDHRTPPAAEPPHNEPAPSPPEIPASGAAGETPPVDETA